MWCEQASMGEVKWSAERRIWLKISFGLRISAIIKRIYGSNKSDRFGFLAKIECGLRIQSIILASNRTIHLSY